MRADCVVPLLSPHSGSQCSSTEEPSGFGFELTLRVRREVDESSPPTWPAHLLQSLARYVFNSQAQLMVGDHIPWPTPLDTQPYQPNTAAAATPTDKEEVVAHSTTAAAAIAQAAASMLMAKGLLPPGAATDPVTYSSMLTAATAALSDPIKSGYGHVKRDGNSPGNRRDKKSCGSSSSSSRVSQSRMHHMLLVEDPQLKTITTPYGYVQFLQVDRI